MKRSLLAAALLFSAGIATAQAAVAFTALALPVVASTDARSITYSHDGVSGLWYVQGPVCPRADPAQVTGITNLPCLEQKIQIPAPSGAFVTKLISDYKLVVLATGYPSGD